MKEGKTGGMALQPQGQWRAKSKRKGCPFATGKLSPELLDYKNVRFLRKYISETGKIVPSRVSGILNTYQHRLALAVRHARYLALLPYCDRH